MYDRFCIFKKILKGGRMVTIFGDDMPKNLDARRLMNAVDIEANRMMKDINVPNNEYALTFDVISSSANLVKRINANILCESFADYIVVSWEAIKDAWSMIVPRNLCILNALEAWLFIFYSMYTNMVKYKEYNTLLRDCRPYYMTSKDINELGELMQSKYSGFQEFERNYKGEVFFE